MTCTHIHAGPNWTIAGLGQRVAAESLHGLRVGAVTLKAPAYVRGLTVHEQYRAVTKIYVPAVIRVTVFGKVPACAAAVVLLKHIVAIR